MIMSLSEWYRNREILITGVTSELGRVTLEKILRTLPNVNIFAVVRSRDGFSNDDRIKRIFASPGYERLHQKDPNAIKRVRALEGNLLYENLGLGKEDANSLKNVEVVLHAAGPHDDVFEFCQHLPRLKSIAAASSLFRHKGQVTESLQNEGIPKIPLALVRFPFLGPAYKEPMPGFVEVLRGPTALMVGAGFALGRSDLTAEVVPCDIATNALLVAAWERGIRPRSDEPTVYNVPALGCTWGDLVQKGYLANRKFFYPTFGVRGITSIGLLHWITVLVLEWIPSALCDMILSTCGAKARCVAEHNKVRKALQALETIATRPWPIERNRIYQLQERLTSEDKETFPICPEIDVESYVLCASASARKHCVDEINLTIVKNFSRLFLTFFVIVTLYFISKLYF